MQVRYLHPSQAHPHHRKVDSLLRRGSSKRSPLLLSPCLCTAHMLVFILSFFHFILISPFSLLCFLSVFSLLCCLIPFAPSSHLSSNGGRGGHPQVSGERGYPWLSVCCLPCLSLFVDFFSFFVSLSVTNICKFVWCCWCCLISIIDFVLWSSGFCQ